MDETETLETWLTVGEVARQIQHLKSLGLSLEEVGAALDVEEAHNTIAQAQGSADDRVAQVASRLFSNRRATASSG